MNPTPTLAEEEASSTALSFAVRHSPAVPAYYELSLEDEQGNYGHWVIPLPLRQLAKRPVLLWLLATSPQESTLACVESGTMRLASTRQGDPPASLRTELDHGVLRLNFNGQLLRGYYRLQCLPTGGGQLWQLTPLSRV